MTAYKNVRSNNVVIDDANHTFIENSR